MKSFVAKFQIGKAGLKNEIIESIKLALKNHNQARISVLKSATRDKEKIKEIAETITKRLGKKKTYKIIGFTIIIRK